MDMSAILIDHDTQDGVPLLPVLKTAKLINPLQSPLRQHHKFTLRVSSRIIPKLPVTHNSIGKKLFLEKTVRKVLEKAREPTTKSHRIKNLILSLKKPLSNISFAFAIKEVDPTNPAQISEKVAVQKSRAKSTLARVTTAAGCRRRFSREMGV